LEELVGFESEKETLVRNTSYFLAGYPANNVFVYGDRGTGKSSAIKALLNHFPATPLRMIEVSRDELGDLPQVMALVRARRERFILFVDDLSFEEGETQYKTLKAVLEGSLEARPKNVLIYASSNRRHLIQEYFSDRNDLGNGEVRQQDTLQEKVSLADRFGIQLVFVTPNQKEYFAIVSSLAKRRKLAIGQEDLERKALQWVQLHNARSGRTARQFIDDLTAELASQASQEAML
jgi:predicted AAA+ superfamily ATPase